MARAWIGLGTNLEREQSLASALQLLARPFRLRRASSVYETDPVGRTDQPPFFNLALEIETDLPPAEVRHILRQIEDQMGRVRGADRWGPRLIDLDLLLYEDRVEQGEGWQVPHPQVLSQPFVLVPLGELIPDYVHPLAGRTLAELLAEMSWDPAGVRRVRPPPL
ncbi:MAG TPA: 2-amino-4-hydroxy-6-hydroxymethyldihydropteridine diphosphokinase [Candidatus Nitrosotenuis sp.]|jgi:2-amino-4-hydroxy-6-hydroxymethyldihydropteridine diphosphokinase|nr:2-amino-4-hydroxy-6-hydroxymethyldihydropteridine diphosphokinase [Candidatus Nitrosotenuis sp.]